MKAVLWFSPAFHFWSFSKASHTHNNGKLIYFMGKRFILKWSVGFLISLTVSSIYGDWRGCAEALMHSLPFDFHEALFTARRAALWPPAAVHPLLSSSHKDSSILSLVFQDSASTEI